MLGKVLEVLNDMVSSGVVSYYAIGGAVGVGLYAEGTNTFDLDIFYSGPDTSGSSLLSLGSVYEYAREYGYPEKKEHIIIHGLPVQMLPVHSPLTGEALDQAVMVTVDGVQTKVFRPEHLVAIMLKVGRPKDRIRAADLLQGGKLDRGLLDEILKRHGLESKLGPHMVEFGDEPNP